MTLPEVPHFFFPFQWDADGHALAVEQDSEDDVASCVKCVILTPTGWRTQVPEFGTNQLPFMAQADRSFLQDSIVRGEPRAEAIIEDDPSFIDEMVTDITSWS
jgi:hypothetical protein